jgi:hypothetical protein
VAEGKSKAEIRQYKEDQFRALEDRREALPAQISNLYHHKGNGSKNPFAKRQMHGCQHHAQAHAIRWVDRYKLKIPEFLGVLQLSEFWYWMLAIKEFFEFNGVPDERRVPLVALTFWGVVATWWQHLKQQRRWQSKRKIRSWEQLLKKNARRFHASRIYHGSTATKLESRVNGCDKKNRKLLLKRGILGDTG